MPVVEIHVRWANGTLQIGESPSTAIERFLVTGASYPRDELRRRLGDGLAAASERVRERFGMACTAAAEQAAMFEAGALAHGGGPDGVARVERVAAVARQPVVPPGELDGHDVDVVVVGGGQAGLSASRYLKRAGLRHVVLERNQVAGNWELHRWDSFCLVTPNWQCQLPEYPYDGGDPDGFMLRGEIVEYVRGFAASFGAPVYEGVEVVRVGARPQGGFWIETSHGKLGAEQVVLAVGGYHRPRVPLLAEQLPAWVTQLHSSGYRNPSSVPDGGVLVVGSGQSGAQIAEDLLLAGRDVHLAVGSAPRVARFYRGRDCVAWLEDMGHYEMAIEDHPQGMDARREPNHYVTGRDGGRDIDLRAHARSGMQLHGRLRSAEGSVLAFASDLERNLDRADATAERIKDAIDRWIEARGIDAPIEPRYVPVWRPGSGGGEPLDLAAAGVRTVIWATGFRSDWSWVDAPAFDLDRQVGGPGGEREAAREGGRVGGHPHHERGVTSVPGLYVLGLPWLHTWGSGRFAGIARDAAHVAERIVEHANAPSDDLERAA